jgi:predicted permease
VTSSGNRKRIFRVREGTRHVERDIDEELAFHLAMRTRKFIDAGLDPESAHAAALAQFGDFTGVRDECLTIDHDRERAMRLTDFMSNLRQDLIYALRSLRQHKQFTAVVMAILTLGIGANTATFTLVDALMFRPLPVAHAEQLVTIGDPSGVGSSWHGTPSTRVLSYPVYIDIRDKNRVLSGVYATGGTGSIDVVIRGGASDGDAGLEHPRGRFVSASFFDVLRVPPLAGRTFTADEDKTAGEAAVAVISHRYWTRRFSSDRTVIGRKIVVNNVQLTIIGVAPPAFSGDVVGQQADLWIPMTMRPLIVPHDPALADRRASWLLLMGRLAPGVTLERARAELSAIAVQSIRSQMTEKDWTSYQKTELRENPISVEQGARGFSYYRTAYARALVILSAAVALVLLVVCANVANLMLARAAARGREMSVRLALGAGRGRLVQQLLTESVVVAALAAVLGLVAAQWGSGLLLRIASAGPQPIPLDVQPNAHVLGYTLALTLLTTILFGLVPAWRSSRVELVAALRTQGRGGATPDRPGRMSMGKMLVVAQVALSALLLVGTGMLLHSMSRIRTADLGVPRDRLVVVSVEAGRSGYSGARLPALMRDLTARLQQIPGVAGVTFSENGIFTGTESFTSLQVPGYVTRADSDAHVSHDAVGPNYVHAIGAQLLQGRDFDTRDNETAPKSAILNETMAKYYFANGEALGRTIIRRDSSLTVIGIVRDIEEQDVRARPIRRMYLSIFQDGQPHSDFNIEVRTAGDPSALESVIRKSILASYVTLSFEVHSLNDLVSDSLGRDRLVTQVIAFFGGLTLVLAALGLYGVMVYTTTRRTSEFGLRMALGASSSEVTRMVVREALGLTVAGLAIGLPAGLGAARLIRGQLFEVGTLDPISVSVAAVVLTATSVIASFLPARRASRVAPLEALRSD